MGFCKYSLKSISGAVAFGIFLMATGVHAQEISLIDRLGGTIGGSAELGRLGNSGMNLDDRTMSAFSVEGLVGYRYDSQWMFGLDLNYRLQQQITPASDVNGTNMKGKGWLFGLGAQYRIDSLWAIQAAIDFAGKYEFDKQTSGGQDDYLHSPLSLRVKAQYFFLPRWTADLSANYIRWSKFHVAGVDHSENATQWMMGLGLTYHFGAEPTSFNQTPVSTSESVSVDKVDKTETTGLTAVEKQKEEISKVLETEQVGSGFKVKLPAKAFVSGKAEMTPEFKEKLQETAKVLAQDTSQKITVKGHADSSGRVASNNKISQARADKVKAALIKGGVLKKNISAIGVGSREPLVDNATPEGRAMNRRVDILIEQNK